jgi:hypothetical protein
MEARGSSASETPGSEGSPDPDHWKLKSDIGYAIGMLDRGCPGWWVLVDPARIDNGSAHAHVLCQIASKKQNRDVIDFDEARLSLGIATPFPRGLVLRGGPLDPRMQVFNQLWAISVAALKATAVPMPHPRRVGPRAHLGASM